MPNSQGMDRNPRVLHEYQINRALGAFLLFFACVVLISIFFTDTLIGKLTNLGAGGIMGLIGAIMMVRSRRTGASGR